MSVQCMYNLGVQYRGTWGGFFKTSHTYTYIITYIHILKKNHINTSCTCCIKIHSGYVNYYDLFLDLPRADGGRSADDESQNLKRRRAREQRVVGTGPDLLPDKQTPDVWILDVAPDHCALGYKLLGPGTLS